MRAAVIQWGRPWFGGMDRGFSSALVTIASSGRGFYFAGAISSAVLIPALFRRSSSFMASCHTPPCHPMDKQSSCNFAFRLDKSSILIIRVKFVLVIFIFFPSRPVGCCFPFGDYNISLSSECVNTYFHFLVIYFLSTRVSV